MPIYEYRCENGHTFEVIQSMSDGPVTACEECGAPVERVFHPVAVHFKGSGFYNTDYKNKGKTGSGSDSKDGDSGSSESKSESGSSESKSESGSGESKSDSGSGGKTRSTGARHCSHVSTGSSDIACSTSNSCPFSQR
jgi:putative FmdB family regulatory protein